MELRHLRYFVSVAEAEHFGRAAERLHVSQSPLSRQIAQLAEEIGVELFVPAGRGVKLTSAGRAFLDGARATLAQAARAVDDAKAAARGRIGTLVIGFEGGLALGGLLPRIVQAFRAQHPAVAVRLLPLASDEQVGALQDGHIAFGYGYHPPAENGVVRSHVLFRDRLGVAMPRTHRLASKRSVRVADLKNEVFVMAPRRHDPRLYDDLIAALRGHGVTLDVSQEVADGEALLTLVASGEGLSFFPESTAPVIEVGAVMKRVRDLDVGVLGRAVWRASDDDEALVRSLREITKAAHRR